MNNKTFLRQIKNQKTHWWFQARKNIIESIILNINFKKKINILDFGAGSGVNLDMLIKYGKVDIHEKNKFARSIIKKNKKIYKVYNSLNFKKKNYDLILLADVIEHIKKPKTLLKSLKKYLKKDGYILITVPAYQFLYSKKDRVLGHYRRYNKKSLRKELYDFKIKKISYFNTFLFLPIMLITIINIILNRDYIIKVETTPNYFLNLVLYQMFKMERFFIKYFKFSFGISLYALVKND